MSRKPARQPAPKPPKAAVRSGPAHWLALVRSVAYSVLATLYFIIISLFFVWIMLFPAHKMRFAMLTWVKGDLFLLRVLCGQRTEILGAEHIPDGPCIITAKHQAAWETLALLTVFPRAVIFLKQELLKIPLYGWYARFFGMLPIDRSAGPAALKKLAADAQGAMANQRQLLIFPEGTRRPVGAPPDYKPGALFLYEKLGVPMLPVALNSGLTWPRGRFVRYPGVNTISILPAIPPGLPRADAKARLIHAVETETDRLVAKATAPGA